MLPNAQKKEAPPPVHVPIEPSGMNSQGTIHFSQGLLPNSCWLVVPASSMAHPQVPVPQIQVMNSVDYMKIIEIACADLAMTTKLKYQKSKSAMETNNLMNHMKERALAMLNASGAPSPVQSQPMSPVPMSPRTSNDR